MNIQRTRTRTALLSFDLTIGGRMFRLHLGVFPFEWFWGPGHENFGSLQARHIGFGPLFLVGWWA